MNRILAIPAIAPAIPVKPRTAATKATTKKTTVQYNMANPSSFRLRFELGRPDQWPSLMTEGFARRVPPVLSGSFGFIGVERANLARHSRLTAPLRRLRVRALGEVEIRTST